ncbi:hypothetical protein BH24PSE2_BH24PSE2_16810 [soil metagenome]
MKTAHLFTAVAAALILLNSTEAAVMYKLVEEAFESTTADARIPAAVGQSIVLRHCPACEATTLQVTKDSRFFIDEQQVPLAEFRRAANRGTHGLIVFYDLESFEVTRMKLHVR